MPGQASTPAQPPAPGTAFPICVVDVAYAVAALLGPTWEVTPGYWGASAEIRIPDTDDAVEIGIDVEDCLYVIGPTDRESQQVEQDAPADILQMWALAAVLEPIVRLHAA